MENAVIAVFDSFSRAREAAFAVVEAGFPEWAVQVTPTEEALAARETSRSDSERYASSKGWNVGEFFRNLFGDERQEHAETYSEALRRGSFLLTVEAETEEAIDRARQVLFRFDPIDVEERATHWRQQGWRPEGQDAAAENRAGLTVDEIKAEGSGYPEPELSPTVQGRAGDTRVKSFRRVGSASPAGGRDVGGQTNLPGWRAMEENATARQAITQDAVGYGNQPAGQDGGDGARSHEAFGTDAPAPTHMHGGSGAAGHADKAAEPGALEGTGAGRAAGITAGITAGGAATPESGSFGQDQRSDPTGSGGPLGHVTAGNADLHESARSDSPDPRSSTSGEGDERASQTATSPSKSLLKDAGLQAPMEDRMEAGNPAHARDDLGGGNVGGGSAAASARVGTDPVQQDVLGGRSLGRDEMGGTSAPEPMGTGSWSGDPASSGGRPDLSPRASSPNALHDEGLGRQTSTAPVAEGRGRGGVGGGAEGDVEGGIEGGLGAEPRTRNVGGAVYGEPTGRVEHHLGRSIGEAMMRDSVGPDVQHSEVLPPESGPARMDEAWQDHWRQALASEGGRYEDFEPAYRYGSELRHDDAFRSGGHWNEIEPEVQRRWESSHADSPWDKAREAVRHAWEKMRR